MSEELDTTEPAPSDEDELSTTPPNPALETEEEDTGWKMPKPVYRKTSGYLPQGFEKKLSQNEAPNEVKDNVDDAPSTPSTEEPVGLVDIEPQPDIHESDPGFQVPAAAAEKPVKKGGLASALLTILLLLITIGLIVAFLAVMYFLFMRPSSDPTF